MAACFRTFALALPLAVSGGAQTARPVASRLAALAPGDLSTIYLLVLGIGLILIGRRLR